MNIYNTVDFIYRTPILQSYPRRMLHKGGEISAWDPSDIYAVSIWVNDLNDNPCQPYIILFLNSGS